MKLDREQYMILKFLDVNDRLLIILIPFDAESEILCGTPIV